jgi:hypothetical protein
MPERRKRRPIFENAFRLKYNVPNEIEELRRGKDEATIPIRKLGLALPHFSFFFHTSVISEHDLVVANLDGSS